MRRRGERSDPRPTMTRPPRMKCPDTTRLSAHFCRDQGSHQQAIRALAEETSDTKNQFGDEPEFPDHPAGRPRSYQSQPPVRQHRHPGGRCRRTLCRAPQDPGHSLGAGPADRSALRGVRELAAATTPSHQRHRRPRATAAVVVSCPVLSQTAAAADRSFATLLAFFLAGSP